MSVYVQLRRSDINGEVRGTVLVLVVDALSPCLGAGDTDARQSARRVLETTLHLARTRAAVPAVDADVRRSVADVEAPTAVAV